MNEKRDHPLLARTNCNIESDIKGYCGRTCYAGKSVGSQNISKFVSLEN